MPQGPHSSDEKVSKQIEKNGWGVGGVATKTIEQSRHLQLLNARILTI